MNDMNIPPAGMFSPPSIVDYLQAPQIGMKPSSKGGQPFSDVLKQAMKPKDVNVHFTKHAEQRMLTRGINLSSKELRQLDEGIDKAEAKGAKSALMLMDGDAFLVNINQRTIITAMNQAEAKGAVFNQIDSTIILD